MNSVKANNYSLKYQRFTPSGCEDKYFRAFDFVPLLISMRLTWDFE